MKLLLYSDLHLEFAPFTDIPSEGYDAVVLAGDTGLSSHGLEWAAQTFSVPVVAVAGNHEFYGGEYHAVIKALQKVSAEYDHVHFLENSSVEIDGVLFCGCILWTDYNLNFTPDETMNAAGRLMNDYRRITYRDMPVKPAIFKNIHSRSLDFLFSRVPAGGPVVFVTHHAPSAASITRRVVTDSDLQPYYASELSDRIRSRGPDLWVHGHTHDSVDYQINRTRIISNPRGYPRLEPNPFFDPHLIIEI